MALLAVARCRVFGIDRDPDAVRRGRILAENYGGRLTIIEGLFGDMAGLLAPFAPGPIAGIVLDLGVSSAQLDTPERGFSFRFDGPLDMRMSREGPSAADLVASLSEEEIAQLIRDFGEERFARRVARAIKAAQRRRPVLRTFELAEIVRSVVPKSEPGQDPATRTFQALRINVNDELGELDRGLVAAEQLLMPGGRLAVVSFHSLEDRRVKQFFQQRSGWAPRASRHAPVGVAVPAASFEPLGRRAVTPGAAEVARNPRARAARLRAAQRTASPAWPVHFDNPRPRPGRAEEMIKLATLFWLVLVSTAGFAMFAVKYQVQSLEDDLNRARTETIAEEHAIRMDEVEWAYLTRPDTLEDMNRRHLSLMPVATTQLRATLPDLPLRPPPPPPVEEVVATAAPPAESEPAPPPLPAAPQAPTLASPTVAALPQTPTRAPEITKPVAAKSFTKPAGSRRPKTLDDLIAQIVASR